MMTVCSGVAGICEVYVEMANFMLLTSHYFLSSNQAASR